ncbi:oxygen-dependent protoporphyrinogen oxidase [Phlyctochytrium planicorne]|nr:oxygen-dependent protoporphyrinogen oxidase [Phlyctochytrium planicorne]
MTILNSQIKALDLRDQIVGVSKASPAAKNRFIYFNNQLNKLPSSLISAITSNAPVLRNIIGNVIREPFVPRSTLPDESIRDFVVRRFGKELADNLVSAVIHGIYAGNIQQLSVRSTVKFLWEMEQKHGSVIVGAIIEGLKSLGATKPIVDEFIRELQGYSVYTFKRGIETLTHRMVDDLRKHEARVVLLPSTRITEIVEESTLQIRTNTGISIAADHVIWSTPATAVAPFMPRDVSAQLEKIQGVDVAVVNLVFQGDVLPVRGFGYLVPQSQPSTILGTVFDSETLPSSPPVTRLTVMMGGHKFVQTFGEEPSPESLLGQALKAVQNHLGISEHPISSRVTIQRNCIPQYVVGHLERLRNIHNAMLATNAHKRHSLIGASYLGVSLNDCVKNARDVSLAISKGLVVTGLETSL